MITIFSFAFISILTAIVFYTYNFSDEISKEHERWGTFGDYFGGLLNPVLSFLSLIALLLTIILQNQELFETRKEIKQSREAQEKSEEALKEQSETLKKQLEEAKKATNAEYFFRATATIQDDEIREARAHLFKIVLDEKKPLKEWTNSDKVMVEKVCQSYDLIGMMIKNGFVDENLILSSWHISIKKSWKCSQELVDRRREKDGQKFWNSFEWLHERSLEYS